MAWLLILILFWQPIFMTVLAIYHKLIKKDNYEMNMYLGNMKAWFLALYDLLRPRPLQ